MNQCQATRAMNTAGPLPCPICKSPCKIIRPHDRGSCAVLSKQNVSYVKCTNVTCDYASVDKWRVPLRLTRRGAIAAHNDKCLRVEAANRYFEYNARQHAIRRHIADMRKMPRYICAHCHKQIDKDEAAAQLQGNCGPLQEGGWYHPPCLRAALDDAGITYTMTEALRVKGARKFIIEIR